MTVFTKRPLPILLLAFLMSTMVVAQKKEKLKGSRIVTTTQKEISDFSSIEVEDNIEIFLTQGNKCELEIEADDNLHDAIILNQSAGNLRISTSKDVYGSKKFSVKITFNDDFKMLIAKDDSYVTALTDINLANFTYKTFGSAKIFSNVKATTFTLMQNDKSKAELNVTADNTMIELNKNAQLKALIATPKLKLDMYLKAIASVEGDVVDLKLRIDGNTNFTGKNLTAKNAEIISEGNANGSLHVETRAVLEASGKSEIELFGEPKIEIRKFTDTASLRKRLLK